MSTSTVIGVCFLVVFAITVGILWSIFKSKQGSWGRKGVASLRVMDTLALDPKRRLVLVARDDTHYLLLLGGPNDVVVEGGITRRTHTHDESDMPLHPADFTSFDRRTLRS